MAVPRSAIQDGYFDRCLSDISLLLFTINEKMIWQDGRQKNVKKGVHYFVFQKNI